MAKGWVKRLKKDIKSILKGPGHSKAGKKELHKMAGQGLHMKGGKTRSNFATKSVEAKLKAAGLTDEEIKRLR